MHRTRRALAVAVTVASFAAVAGVRAHVASAAYTARVQAGTLKITGDAASDKLALGVDPGTPGILLVDVGEDGTTDFSFDRSTFTAIVVNAGAGDDEVRVAAGTPLADGTLTLNGGPGDDTLAGGDSADVLNGGPGSDVLVGRRGADVALLGSGDDLFLWDPGDGSDTIEGQGGHDRLDFNGSNAGERFSVAANGPRLLLNRDVGAVTLDTDGLETVNIRTLGGADTVAVGDLNGTGTKTVDVDLDAVGGVGDGQPDTVVADGTDAADDITLAASDGGLAVDGLAVQTRVQGGEPALDTIDVAGLGGDDTLTTTTGVGGQTPVTFDGGPGLDSAHVEGTGADDRIQVVRDGAAAAVVAPGMVKLDVADTVESLVVEGLGGDDQLVAGNGLADLAALTLDGGAGNDMLIGGDGADTLSGRGGDDVVSGGRGSDVALLGGGDDSFEWNPGDGSDTVEGQGGRDALDFNGSNVGEQIALSANGGRLRLARDVGAVTIDGDGLETLELRTLGGIDTVTVGDLTGTAVKAVDVDLDAVGGVGDGQPDTVVTAGTDGRDVVRVTRFGSQVSVAGLPAAVRIEDAEAGVDSLHVDTLGGNDDVSVAPDVSSLLATTVDLGPDE